MSYFRELVSKWTGKSNEGSRRKGMDYLICVAIATLLWLMNALSQDYSAELNYPVRYINVPQDKYAANHFPTTLQVSVRTKGFTLLGHRVRISFRPITFNYNNFSQSMQQKGQIYECRLGGNDLKERVAGQISSEMKLVGVAPEELVLQFAAASIKKVPVRPRVNYTLKRQHILNGIRTIPDSVTVSGPEVYIDTLQCVYTELWTAKDIKKQEQKDLHLKEMEHCVVPKEPVKVVLDVEQFTEARRRLMIHPQGVPSHVNMQLFPGVVEVVYEVGLSRYHEIKDSDFIIAVDYPKDLDAPYLDVTVKKAPEYIKNLKFTPQTVEFFLEKK